MDRLEKKCRNGARERTRFRARFSNTTRRPGGGGRGRRRKHGGRTDVCTTWRGTCRRRRKWGVPPLSLNSPFVRSYIVSSRWHVCSRCVYLHPVSSILAGARRSDERAKAIVSLSLSFSPFLLHVTCNYSRMYFTLRKAATRSCSRFRSS